ncbi:MAG TPA: hypothetical protein DEO54_09865 [Rikenellaceae bacterium]|nr:MAG: hypothetical protein A2X20_10570 [Bacteroidetes bacterium GWE2_40_15]HBZ26521.1 hypothetical protein [Rikenellaceae bacterium]
MRNFRGAFYLFIIALTALFGCVKYHPVTNPESPIGVIPKDFDWKTIKEISCVVNVSSNDDFGDNMVRVIKIYKSGKLDAASLISTGGATPLLPYSVKISLATSVPTLFFQEILPDGSKNLTEVDVTTNLLNIKFSKSMPPEGLEGSDTYSSAKSSFTKSDVAALNSAIFLNVVAFVDNDGDGVSVWSDIDDNDPNVAFASYFPSAGTWGTYAFEDLWPVKGDYDINDLVIGFNITYLSNSSNMVTQMKIDYNLRAAGCSYQLGAAVQLDNVPASNVMSVSGRNIVGNAPFSISSNGTENGVSLAVIPLFNNQRDYASFPYFLNTINGSYTASPYMYADIKFAAPISQADVTMSAFNLFIAINSRDREVHIPTYAGTSKFNSSLANGYKLYPGDIFKSLDGMMWGLMFPDVFRYPAERNSITSAYTHFASWATSGGASNTDWYLSGSGYTDEEKIYQIPGDTPTIPSVTTADITEITSSSAICGGSVTNGGGAAVSARGICWSTDTAPTLSDNTTSNGNGTGSFTSNILGLSPNTTYYVRAYATNPLGTSYGEEKNFTSKGEEIPSYPGTSLKPVKIEGLWWAPVNAGYNSSVKYGLLYQWHRKYGQDYLNTGVVTGPVKLEEGNDISNAEKFYSSSSDWCADQQPVWSMKDEYNPCPAGWRVPTNPEMKDLLGTGSVWVKANSGGVDNLPGRWVGPDSDKKRENSVFFPAAGYRDYKSGSQKSRSTYGAYWSDDIMKSSARGFDFTSGFISIGDGLRGYGFSIRCVKVN